MISLRVCFSPALVIRPPPYTISRYTYISFCFASVVYLISFLMSIRVFVFLALLQAELQKPFADPARRSAKCPRRAL